MGLGWGCDVRVFDTQRGEGEMGDGGLCKAVLGRKEGPILGCKGNKQI